MTRHETRLWACIRSWREDGIRFRRQVVIGPYIVDFACYRPKVVLEVDGGQHTLDDHAARDAERDAWLESQGFTVFRAWNHEVHNNIDAVIDGLRKIVEDKRYVLALDGRGGPRASAVEWVLSEKRPKPQSTRR